MGLMSAGEADLVQPSTGAVEARPGMVIQSVSSSTAVVTEAEWHAVKSLEEEAGMLFHNLAGEMATANVPTDTAPTKATAVTPLGEATTVIGTATSSCASEIHESGFFTKLFSNLNFKRTRLPHSTLFTPPEKHTDIAEVVNLLKEAMKASIFFKEVKHFFRAFIRMEDAGGQSELMDMLPALTIRRFINILQVRPPHQKNLRSL